LRAILGITHIVLCCHVNARDQAAAFLGDALEQLIALTQEAFAVECVG
jgi:hypothetical protein